MVNKVERAREQAMDKSQEMYFTYEELNQVKRLMPRFKKWWKRHCYCFFDYYRDGTLRLQMNKVNDRIPLKFYPIYHSIAYWLEYEFEMDGYNKDVAREPLYSTIYFTKS